MVYCSICPALPLVHSIALELHIQYWIYGSGIYECLIKVAILWVFLYFIVTFFLIFELKRHSRCVPNCLVICQYFQ